MKVKAKKHLGQHFLKDASICQRIVASIALENSQNVLEIGPGTGALTKWLIEEKKKIKEFVLELDKPYLGFCLGCQLLGEVVGGKVVKTINPEIGMLDVNFLDEKKKDILFADFPEIITSLQWHSYEVQGLENNNDVTLIASSKETKYQIFKYKNSAYGIQFHIEIKDTTVNDWGCVPEYKSALENQLGQGALEKFDKEAKENMKNMNNYSKILYTKFKNEIILNN